MDPVQLTLITQVDCSLCDAARPVIERVREAAEGRFELEYSELNLQHHPELVEKYSEYVPVVLVDGKQHASFTVREDKLAHAIVAAVDERKRNDGHKKKPGFMQRLRDRATGNN
ncbi:MAG: glutaredoxin family protein [Canibacter sp.]